MKPVLLVLFSVVSLGSFIVSCSSDLNPKTENLDTTSTYCTYTQSTPIVTNCYVVCSSVGCNHGQSVQLPCSTPFLTVPSPTGKVTSKCQCGLDGAKTGSGPDSLNNEVQTQCASVYTACAEQCICTDGTPAPLPPPDNICDPSFCCSTCLNACFKAMNACAQPILDKNNN